MEISRVWCVIQKFHGPCRTLAQVLLVRDIFTLMQTGAAGQHHTCGVSVWWISDMEIWEAFLIGLNHWCKCIVFNTQPQPSTDLYLDAKIQPTQCHLTIQITTFSTLTAERKQEVGSFSPPLLSTLHLFSHSTAELPERSFTLTAQYTVYGHTPANQKNIDLNSKKSFGSDLRV